MQNQKQKYTLGAKIKAGFIAVGLFAVVLGGVSMYVMNSVEDDTNWLIEGNLPEWRAYWYLEYHTQEAGYFMSRYAHMQEPGDFEEAERAVSDFRNELDAGRTLADEQGMDGLNESMAAIEAVLAGFDRTMNRLGQYLHGMEEDRERAMQGLMGYMQSLNRLEQHIREEEEEQVVRESMTRLSGIRNSTSELHTMVLRAEKDHDTSLITPILDGLGDLESNVRLMNDIGGSSEMAGLVDGVAEGVQQTAEGLTPFLERIRNISEANEEFLTDYDALLGEIYDHSTGAIDEGLAHGETVSGLLNTAMMILGAGFIILLLAAAGIGFGLTNNITKSIRKIISNLTAGAGQVNASSSQLSSTSQELSEGASEQAAGLQQTSSSLEEFSAQIKKNAENSSEAERAMQEAGPLVESGVNAMERMNRTMEEVREASNETSEIIKTIEDIAFQTNLLALNAAVEAARAGDAGKGFAVVAEEVRSLAKRSSEAVEKTSQMIQKSQDSTERGTAVAGEVAENLQKIRESAGKVSTLVEEISAAGKEQASGVSEIQTVMSEMDRVVQQNASGSEESASAAEELSSQAEELNAMVADLVALVGHGGSRQNGTAAVAPHSGNGHGRDKREVSYDEEWETDAESSGSGNNSREQQKALQEW